MVSFHGKYCSYNKLRVRSTMKSQSHILEDKYAHRKYKLWQGSIRCHK